MPPPFESRRQRDPSFVNEYLTRADSALSDLRAIKRQTTADIDLRIRAITQFRSRLTTTSTPCQPDQRTARLITAPLAGLR